MARRRDLPAVLEGPAERRPGVVGLLRGLPPRRAVHAPGTACGQRPGHRGRSGQPPARHPPDRRGRPEPRRGGDPRTSGAGAGRGSARATAHRRPRAGAHRSRVRDRGTGVGDGPGRPAGGPLLDPDRPHRSGRARPGATCPEGTVGTGRGEHGGQPRGPDCDLGPRPSGQAPHRQPAHHQQPARARPRREGLLHAPDRVRARSGPVRHAGDERRLHTGRRQACRGRSTRQ